MQKARAGRLERRQHAQQRQQVGDIGDIHRIGQRAGKLRHAAVRLQAVVLQSAQGDAPAQGVDGQPYGRAAPIALGRKLVRRQTVRLPAGHGKAVLRPHTAHAKAPQHIARHIHIARAAQGGGEADLAILPKQRQGKEQAADELRGDVARQRVYAAAQRARQAEGQAAARYPAAVGGQGMQQRVHGAGGQLMAARHARPAQRGGHGR